MHLPLNLLECELDSDPWLYEVSGEIHSRHCDAPTGDVLLCTPLVRSIRRAYPDAQLDFLAFEGTTGVIEGNTDLDNIISVSLRATRGENWSLVRRLFRKYDLAVSTLMGDRPMLTAFLAGRKRVSPAPEPGHKGHIKHRLMHEVISFDDIDTHTVEQNLLLADLLEIPRCYEVVAPHNSSDETVLDELLPFDRTSTGYAVVHMVPKYVYKQWPAAGWLATVARLQDEYGLRVVLTGGTDDEERTSVAELAAQMRGDVTNLSGRLRFSEVATLIRDARLYVGPDTSVTHLARAVGTPIVTIFGPTNPVKWGPMPIEHRQPAAPFKRHGSQRVGNVYMVQGVGSCVPCHGNGCDRHNLSRSDCLDKLPVDRVLTAVDEMLAG